MKWPVHPAWATLALFQPSQAGFSSMEKDFVFLVNNTLGPELDSGSGPGTDRLFSTEIMKTLKKIDRYGCWCYLDYDSGRGKGPPQNEMDELCKKMQLGYECAKIDVADDFRSWKGDMFPEFDMTQYYEDLDRGLDENFLDFEDEEEEDELFSYVDGEDDHQEQDLPEPSLISSDGWGSDLEHNFSPFARSGPSSPPKNHQKHRKRKRKFKKRNSRFGRSPQNLGNFDDYLTGKLSAHELFSDYDLSTDYDDTFKYLNQDQSDIIQKERWINDIIDSTQNGDCIPWEQEYKSIVDFKLLSSDLEEDEIDVYELCRAKNPYNTKCGIMACSVEADFLIDMMRLFIGGYSFDTSLQHATAQDFDYRTTCVAQISGPGGELRCCGDYPERFTFRPAGGRECCGKKTFDPNRLKCCDDVASVLRFTCG